MDTSQIAREEARIAEARRVRREELKERRRALARKVSCPKCGALPDLLCRNGSNEPRVQNHQERWDVALDAGVVRRKSRP